MYYIETNIHISHRDHDDPKQGYGGKLGVQNGGQNRTKIVKKTIRKSMFFPRPLDWKIEGKRVPKPAEMEAKMVQNRSQKRAQRKNEKSMKTNNSPTFWLDFGCLRGWKIEEEIEQKSVENDSKPKGNFEAEF